MDGDTPSFLLETTGLQVAVCSILNLILSVLCSQYYGNKTNIQHFYIYKYMHHTDNLYLERTKRPSHQTDFVFGGYRTLNAWLGCQDCRPLN